VIILLTLLSFTALSLWLFMVWAKFWPRVECADFKLEVVEFFVNGKKFYKPAGCYNFKCNKKLYESSRLTLFGGRSYANAMGARDDFSEKIAFVCPVKNDFSYMRQDARVFWGLFSLMFTGIIASLVILFVL